MDDHQTHVAGTMFGERYVQLAQIPMQKGRYSQTLMCIKYVINDEAIIDHLNKANIVSNHGILS